MRSDTALVQDSGMKSRVREGRSPGELILQILFYLNGREERDLSSAGSFSFFLFFLCINYVALCDADS